MILCLVGKFLVAFSCNQFAFVKSREYEVIIGSFVGSVVDGGEDWWAKALCTWKEKEK